MMYFSTFYLRIEFRFIKEPSANVRKLQYIRKEQLQYLLMEKTRKNWIMASDPALFVISWQMIELVTCTCRYYSSDIPPSRELTEFRRKGNVIKNESKFDSWSENISLIVIYLSGTLSKLSSAQRT